MERTEAIEEIRRLMNENQIDLAGVGDYVPKHTHEATRRELELTRRVMNTLWENCCDNMRLNEAESFLRKEYTAEELELVGINVHRFSVYDIAFNKVFSVVVPSTWDEDHIIDYIDAEYGNYRPLSNLEPECSEVGCDLTWEDVDSGYRDLDNCIEDWD